MLSMIQEIDGESQARSQMAQGELVPSKFHNFLIILVQYLYFENLNLFIPNALNDKIIEIWYKKC